MAVLGAPRRIAWPRPDRRTILGVVLAAAAALLVLVITRPPETVPVLVAAQDLPAGVPLDEAAVSVRRVSSDRGLVAGDVLGELAGWSLAAPLAAGEPLVPSQLRAPARLDSPNLISIAVAESQAVLGRIVPGDRVDIFVTENGSGLEPVVTELLAEDVYVVDTRTEGSSFSGTPEVELLLAVDDELAPRLARAAHAGQLDLVKVSP